VENLEHSDVALIDGARHEIDWNREISLRNNRRSFSASHSWIKIGAKVDNHGRYVAFQMAEVAIPRNLFADILRMIAELRSPPVTSTA